MIQTSQELIAEATRRARPKRIVVPLPVQRDINLLDAAAEANLAMPLLIGDSQEMKKSLESLSTVTSGFEMLHEPDPEPAALSLAFSMMNGSGAYSEQVNLSILSTLDAAILSKMSERRQFVKAVVEGSLDIDCALDEQAADRKAVRSDVTGNVDV